MFGSGWCSGMGAGAWVFMGVFWVAFLGLVVWAVTRIFPSGAQEMPGEPAVDTLDRRLAAGEISVDEYRALRDAVEGRSATSV